MREPKNTKTSDTLYKRNGKEISKLEFEKLNKHNDSVSNRIHEVNKMFPIETTSMDNLQLASRLQREIGRGFETGTFTRETNGKIIDTRSLNTTGMGHKMHMGSKEIDTPGNFSQIDTNTINKINIGGYDPNNPVKIDIPKVNLEKDSNRMHEVLNQEMEKNKGKWGQ